MTDADQQLVDAMPGVGPRQGRGTKVVKPTRSAAPKRLVEFFAREAPSHDGGSIYGLLSADGATAVKFLNKPSTSLFTEHEVDPLICPDYHALASLVGEAHFLVVDGSKPRLPVLRWESENAKFYPVDDSFDEFLARLTSSKAKPTAKPKSAMKTKSTAKLKSAVKTKSTAKPKSTKKRT